MSNLKSSNRFEDKERKAVAPIIATLLMVAIAVVGGILIFVFAQGFFNQADVGAPVSDSLVIFGYDTRDVDSIKTHLGNALLINADDNPNNGLEDDDIIALYVRNTGSAQAVIQKVTIMGDEYTLDTPDTLSTTVPAQEKFLLHKGGITLAVSASGVQENGIVQPGEEVTLFVRYNDANNGEIRIGKTIKVAITTGNSAVFSIQVPNGTENGAPEIIPIE